MLLQECLLLCGVVAGPLFLIIFLGHIRTIDHYEPMRQLASALALTKEGWVHRLNCVGLGILMLGCALGLYSATKVFYPSFVACMLIALHGVGFIGIGASVTDPEEAPHTVPGLIQDFFSFTAIVSLLVAFFAFYQLFQFVGAYYWSLYSLTTELLFGVGCALFACGGLLHLRGFVRIAGLIQGITFSIGWMWVFFIALHFAGLL